MDFSGNLVSDTPVASETVLPSGIERVAWQPGHSFSPHISYGPSFIQGETVTASDNLIGYMRIKVR